MTTTVPTEIASFAASVRAHLTDLPAEEVEELTEGLEADLAEAFREDLARELGDPSAYAAELRAAAGLPARESRPTRTSVADTVRAFGRDSRAFVADHPWLERTVSFVASLRPAWWLLRAWAAWLVLAEMFGTAGGPGSLVVLAVLAVGSVALGMGRWPQWFAAVIITGNVVAAVVVLGMATSFPSSLSSSPEPQYYPASPEFVAEDLTGVFLDALPVTNIFAYDAAGQPLSGVQLFDQDGRPLATSVPGGNGCLDPDCIDLGLWSPSTLVTGEQVFNVFPLRMVQARSNELGELAPVPTATPMTRVSPFVQVPAVAPGATPTP